MLTSSADDGAVAPTLGTRLRRWQHLIAGIVLVVPTLAFDGFVLLVLLYCGSTGVLGPVIAVLVVSLPVALPGLGAYLDRRGARSDSGPPPVGGAVLAMLAVAVLHGLIVFVLVFTGLSITSSPGCE